MTRLAAGARDASLPVIVFGTICVILELDLRFLRPVGKRLKPQQCYAWKGGKWVERTGDWDEHVGGQEEWDPEFAPNLMNLSGRIGNLRLWNTLSMKELQAVHV